MRGEMEKLRLAVQSAVHTLHIMSSVSGVRLSVPGSEFIFACGGAGLEAAFHQHH